MHALHARSERNQDVVSRKIEGEVIIVPIRSGVGDLNSLCTLNPVGSVLWDFMNESHTIPEIVQRVCDEFEVTAKQTPSVGNGAASDGASPDADNYHRYHEHEPCAPVEKVKGHLPIAPGSSHFLLVTGALIEAGAGIATWKALESPDRP